MNTGNQHENNNEQYNFILQGQYTAQTKKQFESLSKFVDSNMLFYMTVNKQGLHFISKSKGNITSNVLRLNTNFFDEFHYKEDQFNTDDGIVIKMDWHDFDNAYQLLETDNIFCIKSDYNELIMSQNFFENYEMDKIMKVPLVHQDEDEIQGIQSMQVPIQNILVLVHFSDGDVFTIIDQAFRYLRLENIVICFDFTNEHGKEIHIQNQEQEGGLFKVTLTNFTYRRGAKQVFQIMYDNTLFRRALAFINKNTQVELKVDNNQTLYIISQEEANNTYSETLISGKYE